MQPFRLNYSIHYSLLCKVICLYAYSSKDIIIFMYVSFIVLFVCI